MSCEHEIPLKLSTVFENKITIEEENGAPVVYCAKAWDLYFDGQAVRGKAMLAKYKLARPDEGFLALLFQQWERSGNSHRKIEWEFWAAKGSPFFISRGETNKERDSGGGYRCELVAAAANQGIILTDLLLNEAFSPIDERIMEMYKAVYPKIEKELKKKT